jgi:hypothetical protein
MLTKFSPVHLAVSNICEARASIRREYDIAHADERIGRSGDATSAGQGGVGCS